MKYILLITAILLTGCKTTPETGYLSVPGYCLTVELNDDVYNECQRYKQLQIMKDEESNVPKAPTINEYRTTVKYNNSWKQVGVLKYMNEKCDYNNPILRKFLNMVNNTEHVAEYHDAIPVGYNEAKSKNAPCDNIVTVNRYVNTYMNNMLLFN